MWFKYHLVKVIGSCLAAMLNELIACKGEVKFRAHRWMHSLCNRLGSRGREEGSAQSSFFHHHKYITRHKQIRENTLQNSSFTNPAKPWHFWQLREACVGKSLSLPNLVLAASFSLPSAHKPASKVSSRFRPNSFALVGRRNVA